MVFVALYVQTMAGIHWPEHICILRLIDSLPAKLKNDYF